MWGSMGRGNAFSSEMETDQICCFWQCQQNPQLSVNRRKSVSTTCMYVTDQSQDPSQCPASRESKERLGSASVWGYSLRLKSGDLDPRFVPGEEHPCVLPFTHVFHFFPNFYMFRSVQLWINDDYNSGLCVCLLHMSSTKRGVTA